MTDKRLAPGDPAPEFTLLDADGKIEKAMYGVKATGHVARLRAEVGA